jgi:hypothetical protein
MSVETESLPGQIHPDYPHNSRSAGLVINKSIYWVRNTRQADAKRIAAGEEPVGPVWHYDHTGAPAYLHRDLIAWIRDKYIRALPKSGSQRPPEPRIEPEDSPPTAA